MWRYEHTSWRVQVRAHLSTPGTPAGPAPAPTPTSPPPPSPLLQVRDVTGAWVAQQPLEVPLLPDGVALLTVKLLRPPTVGPRTGTHTGTHAAPAQQGAVKGAAPDPAAHRARSADRLRPRRLRMGHHTHQGPDVVHVDPTGGSLPPPRPFEGWSISLLRPDTASFSLTAPFWWRTPGSGQPGSAPDGGPDGAPDGQLSVDVHVLPART